MISNSISSFLPFFIMGTLSTVTVLYNYYIAQNNNNIDDIDIANDIDIDDIADDIANDIANKMFSDKNIQTETDSVGLTMDKEIQCEFDILELEESGELEAVQARSSTFRWFFLKIIG